MARPLSIATAKTCVTPKMVRQLGLVGATGRGGQIRLELWPLHDPVFRAIQGAHDRLVAV